LWILSDFRIKGKQILECGTLPDRVKNGLTSRFFRILENIIDPKTRIFAGLRLGFKKLQLRAKPVLQVVGWRNSRLLYWYF
jgi:hypothetical protein